jgi:hypothetical protein
MDRRIEPDVSRRATRVTGAALLALVTILAIPAPAQAWGVPGCTNLPEYNRALGALQGMTSACDVPAVQPLPPPTQVEAKRHRRRAHHRTSRQRRAAGR